jgi:succinate dehydrogenase / fumarate reductase flavoprotein subunit
MIAGLDKLAADPHFDLLHRTQRSHHEMQFKNMLKRDGDGENPYLLHQQLGQEMTKAATVVRRNDQLNEAIAKVNELCERAQNCSLSDTGQWTNQNVVFTRSLLDMFPIAKAILKGALARDECRGAHYKPDFDMPGVDSTDSAERRQQAAEWCDKFEAKNRKWLKSTIASFDAKGEPTLSYEDVDTSLIPPRPRLYGIVGGDIIEQVWKERQAQRSGVAQGEKATKHAEPEAVAAS